MPYSIEILPSAAKQIAKLPKDVRRRVARRIDALAVNPRPHGVRQLHDVESLYRVRIGDYRIIYRIKDDRLIVVVVRVGHRRDVYRSL